MAKAAAEGAANEVEVACLGAQTASVEDVLRARSYLFVCPENLGTMSGSMKEFFDRTYYPVLGAIEGRAYATIIAAGSDGSGAQRQIDTIATGWRLRRVVEPMIQNFNAQEARTILARKTVPPSVLRQCFELGAGLGAGTTLGAF